MTRALIKGIGSYLPQKIIKNIELEKTLNTSDAWIISRTGIEQRHIASEQEMTSDLAFEAAQRAIESSKLDRHCIDLIIVATSSSDVIFPSTAVYVQKKLGLSEKVAAFDLNAVCSGFLYALSVGSAYIESAFYKTILIIGAEVYSRLLDWTDRSTCILFGDGAGAVLLGASRGEECGHDRGILATCIHSDGFYADQLFVNGGVSTRSIGYIQMDGKEVYKHAVHNLTKVSQEVLSKSGLTISDVDWLIPHQANKRIIDALGKRLDIENKKIVITIHKHANTAAASIPLALSSLQDSGSLKRGDVLLFVSMGAGFTWGASLIRY